jgi:hypothetical protein
VFSYFKLYCYVILCCVRDLRTHVLTFPWSELAKYISAHKGLEISNICGIVKYKCVVFLITVNYFLILNCVININLKQ